MEENKIKVLIVDDSAIVRAMIKEIMESDIRFTVVGIAENGEKAISQNEALSPDLIVMDINMPIMDGIEATKEILKTSSPAIVAFTTEDTVRIGYTCIEAGALEIIQKPNFSTMTTEVLQEFCEKLALISENHKKNSPTPLKSIEHENLNIEKSNNIKQNSQSSYTYDILLIGASTGGPAAIQTVLDGLGENFPLPILITQHIDAIFDEQFTKWLNDTTKVNVTLAKDGITPEAGKAYVAPANTHLVLKPGLQKGECIISLSDEPPLHFLKPAVDKLFFSAAEIFNEKAIAVLLTGMGKDGAEGLKAIFDHGGYTICEDESSCVVFGMPRAAIEAGAAKAVKNLSEIANFIKARL